MGIDTSHQALRRRLFVTGCSVDLARKIQPGDDPRFERRLKLRRIKEVIFNGISRPEDPHGFQTLNGSQRFDLNFQGKRRRKTLQIIFIGIPPFRFKKEQMGILVGESPELVFNRRAITRTNAVNLPRKERRPVETGTQDVVNPRIRMDLVAALLLPTLLDGRRNRKVRKTLRDWVAILSLKPGKVERPDIDPGRRAGLHPTDRQAARGQLCGKSFRRQLP